jgi:hypothetical protein
MKLHKPLVLESAKTADVSLTPTKKFFKPVLVLDAPLTIEAAALLECAYLFDGAGNPHHFEGHHKLEGELSGALVDIKGQVTDPVSLKSEKVAHIACYRAEKKGMRVHLRIHLPEDEAKLVELLHFLASLNKDGFTATVTDQQGTLIGVLVDDQQPRDDGTFRYPVPNAKGEYPIEAAAKQPFTNKSLDIRLYSILIEEGLYLRGWMVNWKNKVAREVPLSQDAGAGYADSQSAFRSAAIEAHRFLQGKVVPKGVKEVADHEAGQAWLQNIVPELARGHILEEGEVEKDLLQ